MTLNCYHTTSSSTTKTPLHPSCNNNVHTTRVTARVRTCSSTCSGGTVATAAAKTLVDQDQSLLACNPTRSTQEKEKRKKKKKKKQIFGWCLAFLLDVVLVCITRTGKDWFWRRKLLSMSTTKRLMTTITMASCSLRKAVILGSLVVLLVLQALRQNSTSSSILGFLANLEYSQDTLKSNVASVVAEQASAGAGAGSTTPKVAVNNNITSFTAGEETSTRSATTVQSSLVFPSFLKDYIEFHNAQRQQEKTSTSLSQIKYLIWRCPYNTQCGGTGDRIKGILTAFYTAICTGRVLLIDWPLDMSQDDKDVSLFLQPHRIQWTIPPQVRQRLDRKSKLYRAIDNYDNPWFKNLSVPTPFRDHPIIDMRSNLWSEHVNAVVRINDTQCIQTLWQQEVAKNNNNNNNKNKYDVHHYAAQEKYLFRMGFWTMFTFSDAVHAQKRRMQQQAQLLKFPPTELSSPPPPPSPLTGHTHVEPYVAIHIRTGMGGSSFQDPLRHSSQSDFELFYKCAKKLQTGIYQRQRKMLTGCPTSIYKYSYQDPQLPSLPMYVAADNAIAKKALMELDHAFVQQQSDVAATTNTETTTTATTTIRVLEDLKIYHIDRSQKISMGTTDDNNKNSHENPMYKAELSVWAELNVLLESTCLVASRSGFSDLATWLQPPPIHAKVAKRCAVMYNLCQNETKVQQALEGLDFTTTMASCPTETTTP